MSRPEWIEVGRVSRPHGVCGEVRIVPNTDNPERFTPESVLYARPGRLGVAGPRLREQMRLTISAVRGAEGFPIVRFAEVKDRDAAEALRGYVLEIRSSQLPELGEDEFYPFDLVGLDVRDESGVLLGRVSDVVDSPAHALLLVRNGSDSAEDAAGGPSSTEELVPFVRAAVPVIDLAEGYLVLAPGFLQGLGTAEAGDQDRDDPG